MKGIFSFLAGRRSETPSASRAQALPPPFLGPLDQQPDGLEDIIGDDDRDVPKDVGAAPWRPFVCLQLFVPGAVRPGTGTGVLIAPNVVLTAAHNLHMLGDRPNSGRDISKITAHVGVVADDQGRARSTAARIATCPGYEKFSNRDEMRYGSDYGVIWLEDSSLHQWAKTCFDIPKQAPLDDDQLKSAVLTVAGYPDTGGKIQLKFHASDKMLTAWGPTNFRYKLDTERGQSGGPVFRYHSADKPCYLAGVHVGGNPQSNLARRYDITMQRQVEAWLANPGLGRPLAVTS